MNEQLAAALVDFRSQMGAEELSCAGARPLRESICSLAERICKSSDPSSIDSKKQCTEAQKTCSEADRSYRNKCGAP